MGQDDRTPDASASVAVVFGASGGIGQALAAQIEASGRFAKVLRFSRRTQPSVDIAVERDVAQAAALVARVGVPKLMIDATGLLSDTAMQPEKSWQAIDPEQMLRSFAVNAVGPALLMKHLLPLLPRSGRSVFATLSAKVGSIGDNRLGGWYSYRASKAALNQLVRTAAVELARARPDAICVALHPGTVETRLSAPFVRSGLQVQTPAQAAAALLGCLERLTPADSGGFFDRSGERLPW